MLSRKPIRRTGEPNNFLFLITSKFIIPPLLGTLLPRERWYPNNLLNIYVMFALHCCFWKNKGGCMFKGPWGQQKHTNKLIKPNIRAHICKKFTQTFDEIMYENVFAYKIFFSRSLYLISLRRRSSEDFPSFYKVIGYNTLRKKILK